MKPGKVYLVGAGPGDPGLITVKGRRILEQADVVLYDHLAPHSLLALAPAGAERIYVGKKKCDHAVTQAEIVALLLDRARQGKTVVRLKGGDPFLFGRGGEEVEALAEGGVDFEVVPGVTAPLGLAAYAGVPLTHRDHTSVVTFLTGHDPDRIDWSAVSRAATIVVYMGLSTIAEIAARLIAAGRDPSTPAIAVRWATRADQQSVSAPLAGLPAAVAAAGLKPPATIVIGGVVGLRDKLNWFDRLPLRGERIIVTRAASQSGSLAAALQSLGAEVIEFPAIEIRPAADYAALDAAIANLGGYDWLIFTSVNGVRFFLDRLDRSAADLRALRARICAIGPATRDAVERLHLKCDMVPEEYVAESLLAAFSKYELQGKRVLLPRAAVARDLIPAELTRLGARVDVVEAYRTVRPETVPPLPASASWITFTSSSTARNFVEMAALPSGTRIASIGPVTSATVRALGMEVTAEANPYTTEGLVAAILARHAR